MSRLAMAFATVTLSAASVAAAAPPSDDNVVVVQTMEVVVPNNLPADCRVEGRVREVWAGSAYRVGQSIALAVPCSDGKARMEFADPSHQYSESEPQRPAKLNPVVLRKRPSLAAHLDDSGNLIWKPTRRAFGTLGRVVGCRVLDGVGLALGRT